MGYGSWDDDFYADKVASKAATGTPTFDYDSKVKSGAVSFAVADRLNIKNKRRESRDSAAHPESVAIAVCFDVTGSMSSVPRRMQAKLPQLMGLLLRKGYVKDPQVLFAAVGDAKCDRVPLQVGQFESDVAMDEDLTTFVLEGGGGGQNTESYEDALYFFAHRTDIDCFEKRGKKGYLFVIGDELPYTTSSKDELRSLIADDIQDGTNIKEIIKAVTEKYEVFFIIPNETSNYNQSWLTKTWSELLGAERVLRLQDPEAVCELIASTIGLMEGTLTADGIATDLADVGASTALVKATTDALDGLAKSAALVKAATGDLPAPTGGGSTVTRL